MGKYQGDVAAANILGEPRQASYQGRAGRRLHRPLASVGAAEARFSATAPVAEAAKTATYTRAYAKSNGFLTFSATASG
jgi:hypothetical protein